jgi:uncharacterized protein HemY
MAVMKRMARRKRVRRAMVRGMATVGEGKWQVDREV